ncbi:MAG: hypothetical protein MJZ26_02935 [Fibrobacter sp.]|nr:hypothetical protein [Fibrobacter sp.]
MNFSKDFLYLSSVRKSYRTSARLVRSVSTAAVALGFGLGLSACSDNAKIAGGGPSGTEAGNAITAQILTADAKPAALAKVKLTHVDALDNIGSYTAETDNDGSVTIANVADGSYILEAAQGNGALQVNVNMASESVDLGSNNLAKMVSVSGSIDNASEGTVRVRGLDHSAAVVNGEYSLDSLPAGHLDLVFIPKEASKDTISSYIRTVAGESATSSTFAGEKDALLLDDFQDHNNQHRFGPMYFGPSDGGWWYLSHSENVIATNGLDSKGYLKLDKDGDNYFVHATLDFDTYKDSLFYDENDNRIWPWANLGVGIGSNDKSICYDLTSVSSVAFMAKGDGYFKFVLVDESHKTDSFDGVFAEAEYRLSDEWTRYEVNLEGIVDKNRGSLKCVTLLTWSFTESIDFWMDNVELVGGDRLSIWPR